MRYSLRTLLIVMLIAGPLIAWGWRNYSAYVEWKAREAAAAEFEKLQAQRSLALMPALTSGAPVPVPEEWAQLPVTQQPVLPEKKLTIEEARQKLKESMVQEGYVEVRRPAERESTHGQFQKLRRVGQ